jgi:hypothetical protein
MVMTVMMMMMMDYHRLFSSVMLQRHRLMKMAA